MAHTGTHGTTELVKFLAITRVDYMLVSIYSLLALYPGVMLSNIHMLDNMSNMVIN